MTIHTARGRPADDAALDAGWVIARLARVLERALDEVGLTLPQYRVLAILGRGSEGAAALANKLAVKPASVTSVIDGLVARGLVERTGDAADRRKVAHALSTAGEQLFTAARAIVAGALRDVAGHLDPADAAAALTALELWRRALDARRAARVGALQADATGTAAR